MTQVGADAIGLDWTIDLATARQRVGNQVALQGNMDPCVLHAGTERVTQEVATILASYGAGTGHVFNLGHGVHPTVSPAKITTLVDAVHQLSQQYH